MYVQVIVDNKVRTNVWFPFGNIFQLPIEINFCIPWYDGSYHGHLGISKYSGIGCFIFWDVQFFL